MRRAIAAAMARSKREKALRLRRQYLEAGMPKGAENHDMLELARSLGFVQQSRDGSEVTMVSHL